MVSRIYSPGDGETGLTPRDITDLGHVDQVDFMVQWFRALFEDPQNETPYAEKDEPYNYTYIWGGPYDAEDELWGNFDGLGSEEAIQAAVEEVQRDGTFEWAPTSNHPERRALEEEASRERDAEQQVSIEEIQERLRDNVTPQFGSPFEIELRTLLQEQINELRALIEGSDSNHGGMGHNRPPKSIAFTVELTLQVNQSIYEMEAQLAKETPDVNAVVESAGLLKRAVTWIGKKLDKSIDGFSGTIGSAAAVGLAAQMAGVPVWEKIVQVFNTALKWLDTVTLPF